jgi:hypothetical protein
MTKLQKQQHTPIGMLPDSFDRIHPVITVSNPTACYRQNACTMPNAAKDLTFLGGTRCGFDPSLHCAKDHVSGAASCWANPRILACLHYTPLVAAMCCEAACQECRNVRSNLGSSAVDIVCHRPNRSTAIIAGFGNNAASQIFYATLDIRVVLSWLDRHFMKA